MAKTKTSYYGTYCRLDERSADSGIIVNGNDWTIGAELELTPQLHVTARGKEVPRVVLGTRDRAAGFVPESAFRQLKKHLDDGWTCRAFVSLVVYNQLEERYWVEVALVCYDPAEATIFEPFAERIANRIAKGEHPSVNLSEKELGRVIESKGAWADTAKMKLPDLPKGSAYFKTRRTMTESAALNAANGNKGCYIAIIVALVIIIAVIYFVFLR